MIMELKRNDNGISCPGRGRRRDNGKTNFIAIYNTCKWLLFILERIIFLGPRKTLHFIIKIMLVEVGTVSRNVIMCYRGQLYF